MPLVSGFLRVRRRRGGGGPVDPDYGIDEGDIGGAPDQGLPGMDYPDQGLPEPPPGIWPPPTISHPIQPADPDTPPGTIWPPVGHPSHPWRPVPGRPPAPGQGLPTPPPVAGQPLPPVQPGAPSHPIAPGLPAKFWIVAGIPGYGWKYVCVEPSAGQPIQPVPPPVAQPK